MQNAGLGGWPYRRAQMSPDRTVIVHSGRTMTYAEFATRVTRLADRLRAAGVSSGDRVAYLGPNHPSFVETMFATHVLGGTFVPVNFRLTAPEVGHVLADSGPSVLVFGPQCAGVVRDLVGIAPGVVVAVEGSDVGQHDYESWLAEGSAEPIDEPVDPDDVAVILYTSGTTGRPKGAMLTHANLIWNTFNLLVGVDVTSTECTLVSAPLFHVAALAQTLLPTFIKGGKMVLTASWDVGRVYELIERERITLIFGVATMYADFAASPRWYTADLSSLRHLLCGGAAVPESLIRTYQERGLTFCQGYGLTETAPGATFLEAGESTRKVGSAGVPVFFADVRVMRDDEVDAGVDEPGEVLVRGPNVTPGYWNDPVSTAAAFLPGGWFRTGDIARFDAEGHLYVVDRLKDMFISGGENVYPAEVENAIVEHPAVVEAAVIGVPDPRWGEVGRAFVRCGEAGGPTREELREFLLARLAKYKVPVHIDLVEQLPRTGSGKVRKAELRKLPMSGRPVAPPPRRLDDEPDRALATGGSSGRGDER
ncbi:p-hydroxycinnamoyl-CoA synthetase [Saccharothrix sp. ALI-22-I]|uniref:acyl-CoA synthetase n=1 Tax=Saccharothrix sp. ALI-22-I TaxID=1933778 RepID=UPI00097C7F80|nr:long-chain fatty acid--CoA ligase [Saccharothrix sp. ALI-22-I]ONI84870.1 p-hydroxycinnamoyl-CoA synthetase [Saccharothrix sp. ALI-22-I]